MPGAKELSEKSSIHISLVEMLFALVIAEIATEFAVIVDYYRSVKPNIDFDLIAPVAQLTLALFIVSMSWIGWNSSKYSAGSGKIFSWDYVELIVDCVLVVSYFIMVKTTELPHFGVLDKKWNIESAAAIPEVYCATAIFGLYFLWDMVSKRGKYKETCERIIVTVFILVLSIVMCFQLPMYNNVTSIQVFVIDCLLLNTFFVFRSLKAEGWPYIWTLTVFEIALCITVFFV